MRHLQAQAGRQGVLYIVAVQSREESNSETRLTSMMYGAQTSLQDF